MRSIPFSKFHGFGNDYIVVENAAIADVDIAAFARAICNRHTGAGSDGIAVLEKLDSGDADYFCEIVNPDGSIAGFSGNGTRCAVSYLYHNQIWTEPDLRLATRSGVKNYTLLESDRQGHFAFEAEIGKPKFSSSEIPFKSATNDADVIDREVDLNGEKFGVSCVNVGNPVACVYVDDFDLDWRSAGRGLEVHEAFPKRANIVFVKVLSRDAIEIKIWERGAGETAASGTCSSGAAVLSAYTNRTGRDVKVVSEGGVTAVKWRSDDEIVLTGNADFIYSGEWRSA
ncbi:MAG: diaminopimelate epimerase [Acidobacteriota bacterium]